MRCRALNCNVRVSPRSLSASCLLRHLHILVHGGRGTLIRAYPSATPSGALKCVQFCSRQNCLVATIKYPKKRSPHSRRAAQDVRMPRSPWMGESGQTSRCLRCAGAQVPYSAWMRESGCSSIGATEGEKRQRQLRAETGLMLG